jgi:acyl-CoA thioesterase FadM
MWLRFLWMEYTARFSAPVPRLGEHRSRFMCLPHHVDLHLHMNNSLYFRFMDLTKFDQSLRSGFWGVMRAAGVMPVLGSISVRFRKSVKLWQRFEVTSRIISWDERWYYSEHKILVGNDLAAIAIAKSALVDKQGRISADRFAALMAELGPQPPANDIGAAMNALDKLMVG